MPLLETTRRSPATGSAASSPTPHGLLRFRRRPPAPNRCAAAAALLAALLAACSTQPAGPAAAGGGAAGGGTQEAAATRLAVPAHYRLAWADEFDRPGLPDPARWVHDTGRNREGWYNNERQYYSGPRAENAEVRDGRLVITARRERREREPDFGGQDYSSARLLTRGKAAWTYGFFEIRARMPCGKGTWPALWTLGTGGRWPADGELDILEHQGHHPNRASSAVHTAAGSGGDAVSGKARVPTACTRFHDYQMHWTPQGVRFGVDGRMHWHYPKPADEPAAWPFDQPQYLILNLAIGGDLGGPVDDGIFPVRMEIEHVRVYQAPAPARP